MELVGCLMLRETFLVLPKSINFFFLLLKFVTAKSFPVWFMTMDPGCGSIVTSIDEIVITGEETSLPFRVALYYDSHAIGQIGK